MQQAESTKVARSIIALLHVDIFEIKNCGLAGRAKHKNFSASSAFLEGLGYCLFALLAGSGLTIFSTRVCHCATLQLVITQLLASARWDAFLPNRKMLGQLFVAIYHDAPSKGT